MPMTGISSPVDGIFFLMTGKLDWSAALAQGAKAAPAPTSNPFSIIARRFNSVSISLAMSQPPGFVSIHMKR
jgi:hypothetical protein